MADRAATRGCHAGPRAPRAACSRRVLLVGSPNVGKSSIFNRLTGAYATVSNYPGTTVEVARGRAVMEGSAWEVVDTPGMYSLSSITDEERVAREHLLGERADRVVHVVDARNLERMLILTFQLIEAGLPVVLDVNMIDEAKHSGLAIDARRLAAELGVAVVATSGTKGTGVEALREAIAHGPGRAAAAARAPVPYGPAVEGALARLEPLLAGVPSPSPRALGLLLLQDDPSAGAMVARQLPAAATAIGGVLEAFRRLCPRPVELIARQRQIRARAIVGGAIDASAARSSRPREALSRLMIRPLTGFPILAVVLYVGLFLFVGRFGAGYLVDLLERGLFQGWLTPMLARLVARLIPWPVVQDLFVGQFGILSMGLRYAVAIILPIVGTYFLAFSLLEDSGYLPRLALLVDRAFKRIGLNGRAVIPMVLGFGCDTMATVVTRTLETRRERVIATLLLALAIPCSAQLGVILALLAARPLALAVWAVAVLASLLLVGALSARLLPGSAPTFAMELPPLRLPRPANVLAKTGSRMRWYLLEIIPVFLIVSTALWLGKVSGFFDAAIRGVGPVMAAMGLPPEAGSAFLMGFFRRDYGAAGLYDLARSGALSARQLVVGSVTLTLFLPCVAQVAVMLRERGLVTTLAIVAFIVPFAFGVGWGLNVVLAIAGLLG